MKFTALRLLVVVSLVVAVALALTAAKAPLLTFAGRILVRDDRPQPVAPYVALLLGDPTTSRAEKTAELVKRGVAGQVLIARENPAGFGEVGLTRSWADVHKDYLVFRGVAKERITIVEGCATTSTIDEATCLLAYLRAMPELPERVAVVTSWYHSARAGWHFESAWAGANVKVEISPAYASDSMPENWWLTELPFLAVFNEYLKWAFWLVRSGGVG